MVIRTKKKPDGTLPRKNKRSSGVESAIDEQAIETQLKRINLHAAGIDIGATSHFVAVPPGRDEATVREFPAFTADLERLADWLEQCHITTVAMESTGVYWIAGADLTRIDGLNPQSSFFRRQRARLGSPKAIAATAHKLATIFYSMLKNKTDDHAPDADYDETQYRKRVLTNLKQRAAMLGFDLIEHPSASAQPIPA